MVDYSEIDDLVNMHNKMRVIVQDVTPSINDKMRKNLDVNLQKINIVELAKVYSQNGEAFQHVRIKHKDIVSKLEYWMNEIAQHHNILIENREVSRVTQILADINGTNENGALEAMMLDLKSYLKCLVQDFCKKSATFHVRANNTKSMLEQSGLTFNPNPPIS